MKSYLLAIALICYASFCIAQNSKIDSLKNELATAQSIVDSTTLVQALARYYQRDTSKFREYTYLYSSLAKKTNEPYIIGTSYKLNSVVYKNRRDYQTSAIQSELALKEFIKIKDTTEINVSLYALFQAYRNQDRPNKAIETYTKYRFLLTPKWEFEYHYQNARYYLNKGEFDKSLNSLQVALEMNKVLNDNQLLGKAYYKVGQIYLQLKNYDDAILNFETALQTLTSSENTTLYGSTYLQLAKTYENKEEYRIALQYYDSAIYYQKIRNLPKSVSKTLSSKAFTYFQLQEYDSAKVLINEAIKLHKKEGDERALAFAYSRLGNILFYSNNQKDSAIYYMKQSLEIAQKYKLKSAIKASHFNLSEFLYEEGKFKGARDNLYQAYKYADTLYDEKLNSKLKDIESELKRTEDKNTILSKDILLQQEQIKKKNLSIGLILAGILVTFLIFVIIFFRKRNQKQKLQLDKNFESIKTLQSELFVLQESLQKRNNNFNISLSLDDYLKKEFKLTNNNAAYWDRQAYGLSEKEMARLWGISLSAVEDRRKALYKRLSTKTGEQYTRDTSVALYLEELTDFKNHQIKEALSISNVKEDE